MNKYSRVLKGVILVTVVITCLLSPPSATVAKGKHANPVGNWFCTVQNPIIPTENLLLSFHAGGTLSMKSTNAFLGLSRSTDHVIGSGHGVWKAKGRRIATTTYAFVFFPVESLLPLGYLEGTLAIPCNFTFGGKWLEGKCDVHIYLPEDPDGDGVTNSPYPPEGKLLFPPVKSDVKCKRLPMMKKN